LPAVDEELVSEDENIYSSAAVHSAQGPARGKAMLELDKPYAYMVFDADHDATKYYDRLTDFGLAWRADSLEDLADSIGIPVAVFTATINKYNADYENGGDTEFGTVKEAMSPVMNGPYYAVQVSPISMQANAAVFVDNDMTVLMSNGGERIENLYAAGGAAGNSFFNAGCGTHMGTSLTSGAYAAECARIALIGE
jgi:hypothetical protein